VEYYPYTTDVHTLFRKTVQEFVRREVAPRVDAAEERQEFPLELFPIAGQAGLLCVSYPEEYGAAGADTVAEAILAEELAYCCAGIRSALMVQSSIATRAILTLGTDEQKRMYLPLACRGDKIFALGQTEPNVGSDVKSIETSARLENGHYVIDGTKMFISNGGIADYVTIVAQADRAKGLRGICLFIVPTNIPGFRVGRKLKKMGHHSSNVAELILDGVRVSADNRLGPPEGAWSALMDVLTTGRITVGAAALGIARAALDASLAYARQRVQFGRPIAEFQAIQFKLAEMAMGVQAAAHLIYHAAWLKDTGQPYVKEASMAKLYASELGVRNSLDAIQIHGGYGYISEFPVERMMRDAKLLCIGEGTSEIQHMIIARQILK
jgi:alkylation response protein AidB-like acyl-CoA dehydrogenase